MGQNYIAYFRDEKVIAQVIWSLYTLKQKHHVGTMFIP